MSKMRVRTVGTNLDDGEFDSLRVKGIKSGYGSVTNLVTHLLREYLQTKRGIMHGSFESYASCGCRCKDCLKAAVLRMSTYPTYESKRGAAHGIVQTEVLSGRMTREPCEICGEKKVDGHHDDYDNPLEVRWLCRKHHNQLHSPKGIVND